MRRWWELWKAYSGVLEEDHRLTCLPDGPKKEAPNPGPIPNTELLEVKDDHSTLKAYVDEGSGYRVLSQGSWNFLSKLYCKNNIGTSGCTALTMQSLPAMLSTPLSSCPTGHLRHA